MNLLFHQLTHTNQGVPAAISACVCANSHLQEQSLIQRSKGGLDGNLQDKLSSNCITYLIQEYSLQWDWI